MISQSSEPLKYKRILLKYSGEALMGAANFGIDPVVLDGMAADVAMLFEMGVEIGLVVGAGNLFRGRELSEIGVERVTGDQMGMLATVMNALALRDALERNGLTARVMSAIPIQGIVELYDRRQALHAIHRGEVVIFAAGVGSPFFTTDSAACLRAIEINADIVLKATKVDGVYSADPFKDPTATRYEFLTYNEVLAQGLQVMDATAICLCQDDEMPLRIYDMTMPNALKRIVKGEPIGTIIGVSHDQ